MSSEQLLIAIDVDGTAVRSCGTVSPRVRSAIRAVHAALHYVVLSTGRTPSATTPVFATLGIETSYAVCSNGAVTIHMTAGGTECVITREETFEPDTLLSALEDSGLRCALAVEVPGNKGFRAVNSFPADELIDDVVVAPWSKLGLRGARRVIIDAANSPRLSEVIEVAGLNGLFYATSRTGTTEVGPQGVSKASALEHLRVELGVERCQTIAVGDDINDLEMLRWAARGIAMGQAPPVVRAAADSVTGCCNNDGLADVLELIVRQSSMREWPISRGRG